MSDTKTTDADEKYRGDVYELREEFSELEEKKRESLEKTSNSVENHDSLAISGWVENLKKHESYSGKKVDVKVSYTLNGNKQTEVFTLDRPSDETDFSVDNEFVRFVNLFSDRRNDPSGLLEREVWLKVTNGDNVQLHIPSNMSRREIFKQKMHRYIVKNGLSKWSDPVIPSSGVYPTISASLAGISVLSLLAFAGETSIMFMLKNFLASTFMLLMFGSITALFFVGSSKQEILRRSSVFIVGSVVVCVLGIIGAVDFTIPANQSNEFQTTLMNMIYMLTTWISIVGSVAYGYSSAKSVSNMFISRIKGIKRKFQKRRGIEYVEK